MSKTGDGPANMLIKKQVISAVDCIFLNMHFISSGSWSAYMNDPPLRVPIDLRNLSFLVFKVNSIYSLTVGLLIAAHI